MKKPQGLAAMTPERRREICSLGGKAVSAEDRSFAQNRDLARTAGAKGGSAPSVKGPRNKKAPPSP